MRWVRNLGEIQGSNFSSIAGFGLKAESQGIRKKTLDGRISMLQLKFEIAAEIDRSSAPQFVRSHLQLMRKF